MAITAIRTSVWTAALAGAVVCGTAGFGPSALAQAPAAAAPPVESQEITVDAPEVIRMSGPARVQQRRRRPVEVMMTARQVSFADLDLSRPADVATLRQRVKDAARDACRQIANAAPAHRTASGPPGCEARASLQAMAVVNALAAAARSD